LGNRQASGPETPALTVDKGFVPLDYLALTCDVTSGRLVVLYDGQGSDVLNNNKSSSIG